MAYSGVDDLLLGDLVFGPGVDRQKFIDQAAEDMDAKLGFVYRLPLTPRVVANANYGSGAGDWKLLPLHEQLLLKGINNKMASGRLILTLDISGEGTALHGYGWQLVRDSTNELLMLSNGDVFLSAQPVHADVLGVADVRTPGVTNEDDESLLLGFENTVMRGRPYQPWYSQPGKVPKGPWWPSS